MSAASPVDLAYPFVGKWLIQNSPANRVPSHGTRLFASAFAIDFVPVDDAGRSAPLTVRALTRPEPPERFPGFGRPIYSPVSGVVVAVDGGLPDHPAYRGLPSLGYAFGQRKRATLGWGMLAGNHVGIDTGSGVVFLCHLRRGSVRVPLGAEVKLGQFIAECGNSGNSTEPHLHVQAIGSLPVDQARALPVTFQGSLPRNGEIVQVSSGQSES